MYDAGTEVRRDRKEYARRGTRERERLHGPPPVAPHRRDVLERDREGRATVGARADGGEGRQARGAGVPLHVARAGPGRRDLPKDEYDDAEMDAFDGD
ncbi:hypothetical protein JL721_12154 [Aureococcus anophagefferens]|nr:hypothetical protein JL721_12154 [Aureococcus anophagefferens]